MSYQALHDLETVVGESPAVILTHPIKTHLQPQFTQAVLLPGVGMNVFQLTADVPGHGSVELLESPHLREAHKIFGSQNISGNVGFQLGGALLAPFANRVRGQAQGSSIAVQVGKKIVKLPANWAGPQVGAEAHALHGLVLKAPFEVSSLTSGEQAAEVEAQYEAGDFGVGWPSRTCLYVRARLQGPVFTLEFEATNVGRELLPMGLGWHPYFRIPSGHRSLAKLKIPATSRALVNNYGDVFPTGEVEQISQSKFDFSKSRELGLEGLDDCFLDLTHEGARSPEVELIDPATDLGIRLRLRSPSVQALQVFAPRDKNFVAIEPQFNLADPFSSVWNRPTGLVALEPGQSVTYAIELELFKP